MSGNPADGSARVELAKEGEVLEVPLGEALKIKMRSAGGKGVEITEVTGVKNAVGSVEAFRRGTGEESKGEAAKYPLALSLGDVLAVDGVRWTVYKEFARPEPSADYDSDSDFGSDDDEAVGNNEKESQTLGSKITHYGSGVIFSKREEEEEEEEKEKEEEKKEEKEEEKDVKIEDKTDTSVKANEDIDGDDVAVAAAVQVKADVQPVNDEKDKDNEEEEDEEEDEDVDDDDDDDDSEVEIVEEKKEAIVIEDGESLPKKAHIDPPAAAVDPVKARAIAEIKDIFPSCAVIEQALQATRYNKEEAVNWIIERGLTEGNELPAQQDAGGDDPIDQLQAFFPDKSRAVLSRALALNGNNVEAAANSLLGGF